MKSLSTLLAALLLSIGAHAATWPSKPVKIITGLPVGSGPDVLSRKIADRLQAKWGVPVVVEARPGAAGEVGLSHFANQPVDNHTFYFGDQGNFTTMPILNKKETLAAEAKMIAPVLTSTWAIITPAGIKTVKELEQTLRNKPFYGSWGVGSAGHMCGAEFTNHFGITGIHAPYKDFGSMFADVARGDLTFVCASIASSQNYYKAGTVNYIAVTADTRNQNYRDIPSLRELLPNNNFYIKEGWVAFFVNRAESAEVAQRVKDDVVQVMNEPAMLETLNSMNYSAIPAGQLDRRTTAYSNEIPQWKKIIDRMKVKLD